jgi:hypothetical protein
MVTLPSDLFQLTGAWSYQCSFSNFTPISMNIIIIIIIITIIILIITVIIRRQVQYFRFRKFYFSNDGRIFACYLYHEVSCPWSLYPGNPHHPSPHTVGIREYCMYIVLCTDALFNDAVRNSDYIASNVSMITEQGIGKDV